MHEKRNREREVTVVSFISMQKCSLTFVSFPASFVTFYLTCCRLLVAVLARVLWKMFHFLLQMCIFLTLLSVELSQLQQSDTWADTISFPERADWNFIHSGLCDWGHLVDKKPRHSKHYCRLIVLIARRTNSLRRSARESMNVWICWFVVTLHFCFVWKNMHENEQFIHHLQKLSIWAQCFL